MCCYNSETVQLLYTLHWAAFQKNVEIAASVTVISPYIDELDFIKLIIDYILFFTLYCCVVNIKLHLILPRLAHNNHIITSSCTSGENHTNHAMESWSSKRACLSASSSCGTSSSRKQSTTLFPPASKFSGLIPSQ